MVWVFLNKKYINGKIEEPNFIYSLGGGMGNLAKIVGESLIRKYKPRLIGYLISKAFPDVSYSNSRGILNKFYAIELYHFRHNEEDFLMLYGNLQPGIVEDVGISLEERYELTIKVLRILKSLNAKLIVSIGGLGMELEPDSPELYIAYNKYFNKRLLEEKNIEFKIFQNNNVIGMSGLFVSLARFYKIPAFIMLAETYNTNQLDGYIGASKILDALNKLYGFDIDTTKLFEKGKALREKVKEFIKKRLEKIQREKKLPDYFG